jgi:hypothetical protein
MKKSYKFISVNEMRQKLDNARFEYTWVFSNGVSDEQPGNDGFKRYLKRVYLSNDYHSHIFSSGNKFYSNLAGNNIKPKRKWILFEQLQLL